MLRCAFVEASWTHRRHAPSGYVSRVGRRVARREGAARGGVAAAHALWRDAYAILRRAMADTPDAPRAAETQGERGGARRAGERFTVQDAARGSIAATLLRRFGRR
jgi:hypothetical protein